VTFFVAISGFIITLGPTRLFLPLRLTLKDASYPNNSQTAQQQPNADNHTRAIQFVGITAVSLFSRHSAKTGGGIHLHYQRYPQLH